VPRSRVGAAAVFAFVAGAASFLVGVVDEEAAGSAVPATGGVLLMMLAGALAGVAHGRRTGSRWRGVLAAVALAVGVPVGVLAVLAVLAFAWVVATG
jgi:hypothetical protein